MMQSASTVMMIRPAGFQFNTETAVSNEFQNNIDTKSRDEILEQAQLEFDTMVSELKACNIDVLVIDDTVEPIKPDAIFPNNWISMSQVGVLTIFPMKNENRQREKRQDIVDQIVSNYQVRQKIDLSEYESKDMALEGTGSIVYDHIHKIAYACISPRTEVEILNIYCDKIGYTHHIFHSYDRASKLIYHTNVVMCVGTGYVVIGLDTVTNLEERKSLIERFQSTNLEVIELTNDQLLNNFAGNMLQVQSSDGILYLVMSRRAYTSLTDIQKGQIEKYAKILPVSIDIIETIGGGSARCMMAEVFLTKK